MKFGLKVENYIFLSRDYEETGIYFTWRAPYTLRYNGLLVEEILQNKDGTLYIDGVSSLEIAEIYDTPVYVMSERRIRENYRRVYKAFSYYYPRFRIFYSAKANTNLTVLRVLESEGSFIDTVSPGEVFLAIKAGFKPQKILFTGTSVRDDELKYLLEKEVIINVDSLSQLTRMLKISIPQIISIRVNTKFGAGHHQHVVTAGKETKFGIWGEDVIKAYSMALEAGVESFGIHMHIGSGILSADPFLIASGNLLEIARKVREKTGIQFDFIDLGGGFGVPYRPDERELNIKLLAERITSLIKKKVREYRLGEPFLYVEPGRYIVCDAGVLLTRVNTIKVTPFKTYVGVDAGFNTLIRPTMYGAYHPIILANKLNSSNSEKCTVVGPICESGDILAQDRYLPKVSEGDLIAILNAGAYGFSMSSQYNSRPRCAEVIVLNGKHYLIREREKFEDLLKGQHYPPWL